MLDKVKEEIEEIKNAETDFELASEIGDLFFALVNVARWKHMDAEVRLAGNKYEIQKALCLCRARCEEAGTWSLDLVPG